MKWITLTKGAVTIVDDEDYTRFGELSWYLATPGYAACKPKNSEAMLLHRVILNAPSHLEVDHINGDPLDNRQSNLRLCDRSGNRRNVRAKANGCGFKGVTYIEKDAVYQAYIQNEYLGRFTTAEEAAVAYDHEAIRRYGAFARLNFSNDHRFGCVVADPPWCFTNTFTRGSAERHYPTMSEEDIALLQINQVVVRDLVKDDAHLLLWTTDTHIKEALLVMTVWGFTFKQTIAWVKTRSIETKLVCDVLNKVAVQHKIHSTGDLKLQIGMGNYYRHAHELCLFGVRGRCPAKVKNLPSVIFAPRQEHSAKPDILMQMAEQLSSPPGLEMFARAPRQGWTSWGLEADGLRLNNETLGHD